MKTLKYGLVQIVAVMCFLILLSNTASARTSLYIGAGFGHSDFQRGYQPDYRWGPHRYSHHYRYFEPVHYGWRGRHYRPHVRTIIVGSGYWYCGEPDYYVVTPPPQVIEKQVVLVQPKDEDKDTQALFEALRYRKSELLKKLQTPDKEQRKEAISELAGFSFDDQVRQALENILLSDPDPELRIQVARVFGEVNNTKALPALEKARVEDPDEDVRKEADNAIKKIESN
jgi:hypothetical protein